MTDQRTKQKRVQYYDLKKNWRKVKCHLDDAELNDILVADFNKYTFGRWRQTFTRGHFPDEFESCDWRWGPRGRYPAFWRYVKHAACLGELCAAPGDAGGPWRIPT